MPDTKDRYDAIDRTADAGCVASRQSFLRAAWERWALHVLTGIIVLILISLIPLGLAIHNITETQAEIQQTQAEGRDRAFKNRAADCFTNVVGASQYVPTICAEPQVLKYYGAEAADVLLYRKKLDTLVHLCTHLASAHIEVASCDGTGG